MNITQCPQCGGKVKSESIGWTCESCQGFIDMQGGFHPHKEELFMPIKTNADRIRTMDDGSLLDFFVESSGGLGCPPNKMAICDEFDKYGRDACRKCWDNYLTSPVEEDT